MTQIRSILVVLERRIVKAAASSSLDRFQTQLKWETSA